MTDQFPRRIVFHGLGALGVAAVLAGCGSETDDDPNPGAGGTDTTEPTTPTTSDTPSKSPTKTGAVALATTAEIPVDGGLILTKERIVITQPTAGDFRGFSAVCTHQGCTVSSVSGGTINCGCHGSVYDAATGENIGGPAPSPLAAFDIKVRKGKIFAA